MTNFRNFPFAGVREVFCFSNLVALYHSAAEGIMSHEDMKLNVTYQLMELWAENET